MNAQGIEFDQLTGLYSRWSCYYEIQKILEEKQQKIYCSIDLHNFKSINLEYGVKKGDELLVAIGNALKASFPDGMICRLSGDEFGYFLSPRAFNQYEMSVYAHSLFSALRNIKVEGLEKEHLVFSIGAVYIDPYNFNSPDEVLMEGVQNRHKAKEHTGNFIWSNNGAYPDVEGCFIELSEYRILYNSLNNRLFSIHDESDWFNYLHDGAVLKETMFSRNEGNIEDIITYFKTQGLPDFEYECLFQLVVKYARHIDAYMFEMLANDILIPYFESLEATDRERSHLGHLYLLMVDSLISMLRMGDISQMKRIRMFIQKARDISHDFPHNHVGFEPYFYTLCEIVGNYESLQGVLCDIEYIDEAYQELRELLIGKDPFVVPHQGVYDYFSDLVDNARLFPIFRACFLLINKPTATQAQQEEYKQRIQYIKDHQVDGVFDLAAKNSMFQMLTTFLQTLLLNNLSVDELLEGMIFTLHTLRTSKSINVSDSNIVIVAYLFLGASRALIYCHKTDEEKCQIGIQGLEFLIEILRKRKSYATDNQLLFLIRVLMKSMCSTPIIPAELKYHFIKQIISATMLDTYCHTKAVSSYAKLILGNIIDYKPELLVGAERPYKTVDDVKANRENLLQFMECGCMLHDLGKINIVPITSNAYRRLTQQEFDMIRRHPAFGISYLKEDKAFEAFLPFAYEHHRWWNGEAGYPKTEKDYKPSQFKILVDILSLCDSLEAATSRIGRNYRSAKTFLQILDEFIVDSGTHYCADIVNFIIGNQNTYYQLRLSVDHNWQNEYLSIFQEVISKQDSDYHAIKNSSLPNLYTNNVSQESDPHVEKLSDTYDAPEWLRSMSDEEHKIFTSSIFNYTRFISDNDKTVTFFYTVATDRVGFIYPTPEGNVETVFINHFSEQRLNLVLSEDGYRKAIGIIHRIINEPDFPKQGVEKLEYSDKSRCLITTFTSIVNNAGKVLSIAGRLQDINLSTERLLQTISKQNKIIEIYDSILGMFVAAAYSDIDFKSFEILKGFPALDAGAKNLRNTVELTHFVCNNIVDEEYQKQFLEFLDHTTIKERLHGKPYLSLEYHSRLSGWLLARLIPVKFDLDGNITNLLFVCESTEVEHKQKAFLQYAATHDALTGLINRAHGQKLVSDEIRKSKTQIFAILDCDRFKQINDQLSHLVGDKVLSSQGAILKEFFEKDLCFRLGGDEFVAYLNGEEAARLINSFNGLRNYFEQLKKNLSGLLLAELENIPPTMSLGVVYTNDINEPVDFETLYHYADEALKQSKKTRFGTITITELTSRQL